MKLILLILFFIFQLKKSNSLNAKLVLEVNKTLESIVIDDIKIYKNKGENNSTFNENINVNFGNILKITISNDNGDYWISGYLNIPSLNLNYSTNYPSLWTVNDSRCDYGFILVKNNFINNFSIKTIGGIDYNPSSFNTKFSYYTFNLELNKDFNENSYFDDVNNKYILNVGEDFNINFKKLIRTKLGFQSTNSHKITFTKIYINGELTSLNNVEFINENEEYDVQTFKLIMKDYGKTSSISYIGKHNEYKSKECNLKFITCQYNNSCYLNSKNEIVYCNNNNYYYNIKKEKCEKIPEGKYYDRQIKNLNNCSKSCKYCYGKEISKYNQNCIICEENYYNIEGYDERYCISKDNNIKGYYFDRLRKKYMKYVKYKGSLKNKLLNNKCFKRIFRGNEDINKNGEQTRIQRQTNDIPSDTTDTEDTEEIETCPIYYIQQEMEKECVSECEYPYPYLKNNVECVQSCYIIDENGEPIIRMKYENKKCVEECSQGYMVYNTDGNECEEIKMETLPDKSFATILQLIEKNIVALPRNVPFNGEGFSMEIISTLEEYTNKLNLSFIDLGDCDKLLREEYELKPEKELLVAKFDFVNDSDSTLTGIIRFNIYSSEGKKLDVNHCEGSQVKLGYPLKLNNPKVNLSYGELMFNNDVDIFKPTDNYFNDICKVSKGENADLTLNKRREDQYVNISICENGCTYKGIDYTNLKAMCDCDPLISIEPPTDTIGNFGKAFSTSLPKTNLIMIKCANTFNSFDNLKNSIGFWFFFFMLILVLLFFIFTFLRNFNNITNFVDGILKEKSNPPIKKVENNFITENKEIIKITKPNDENKDKKLNESHRSNNQNRIKKVLFIGKNSVSSRENLETDSGMISERNYKMKYGFDKYIYNNDLIKKDDDDINKLPFYRAVEEDDRSFISIYWDYFSNSFGLLNAISLDNEYDLICIKLNLFISELAVEFFLNSIFYNDGMVEEKYEKGELSLVVELLRSLYSFLVGIIFTKIVAKLSYFEFISVLKTEYDHSENFVFICQKFVYKIKRNLIIMFIINILLMLFMLYYCSIFCFIYHNNQIDWFKGGWMSLGMSLLTSIIIAFVLALIRYIALSKQNKALYNISIYFNRIL